MNFGYEWSNMALAGGYVFLILLVVAAILYLVLGSLVNFYVYGLRGEEIIPNVEFWKNLPSNIQNMTLFICRGCRGAETGYEEI